MARLVNQIVCVCGWLTNFSPALVPVAENDDIEENRDTEVQTTLMIQSLKRKQLHITMRTQCHNFKLLV